MLQLSSALGVVVRVSPEVAMVFAGIGALFVLFVLLGGVATWLQSKADDPAFRNILRVVSLLLFVAGAYVAMSFYFESDQHDPVYRGLERFSLSSVILVAICWGLCASFASWSRVRPLSAPIAFLGGIVLALKPVLYPLISDYGGRPYSLTSETHLYFVLSGLALFFLGFFFLGAASNTPAAVSVPRAAPQATSTKPAPIRMIVAAEYDFSKIDSGMRQLGLFPAGAPDTTPPGTNAEPLRAAWTDGSARIEYTFTPSVSLRRLDFSGGTDPKYMRNDVLNILYMPSFEGYKINGYLESQDVTKVRYGLLAAEVLGGGSDHKYYLTPVRALLQHPSPEIAGEARRVLSYLESQA